jgi:flagellar biogenesis protein FliO
VQQAIAIAVVLAALWGVVWLLRRKELAVGSLRLRRNGSARMQQIERLHLTPQHSLHLLLIEGQKIVLAVHPHGVTLVSELGRGENSDMLRQLGDAS